jgi:hypothetical protein
MTVTPASSARRLFVLIATDMVGDPLAPEITPVAPENTLVTTGVLSTYFLHLH